MNNDYMTSTGELNKKILVTNALPYANGSVHIGHLVGYIQADIWVRFQKMKEKDCLYLCASDSHGTPIMLSAESIGLEPEALAEQYTKEHAKDFHDFLIEFDNYHSTHTSENEILVGEIFNELNKSGYIEKKIIEQAYDKTQEIFLPDRYVKGTCPQCSTDDQYGDNCEKCGATYKPTDLINPISVLSGKTPILKKSEHYFMKLSHFEDMLKKWIPTIDMNDSVKEKLNEWFSMGLKDWDISRDHPYFGFKIPGENKKYFYVWLDAPIGYLASLKNLASKSNVIYEDYFSENSDCHLVHFIGKDIIYFHTLFWPAVLEGAGLKKPNAIFVNGFLTVNGKKMSKSRGTFIKARTYLNHSNPEYLRYYFAYKTNSKIDDFDFDTVDFENRVNADLVGKWINIASRSAKFINQYFKNKTSQSIDNPELIKIFQDQSDDIGLLYEKREFGQAMRKIMLLADQANQYLEKEKPWILIKDEINYERVHAICTTAINLFLIITIYLKPVVPDIAKEAEKFLNLNFQNWNDINKTIINHNINDYPALLTRIKKEDIESIINNSK